MAEQKSGQFVLLLTFVVLLLGFFSSQIVYTGDFSTEVIGKTNVEDLTCSHLKRMLSLMQLGRENIYNKRYDLNVDDRIDRVDFDILVAAIDNKHCPLPQDCLFEGDTSCARSGALNLCVRGPFGLRWVEQPIPAGHVCSSRGTPHYVQQFYG